MAFFPAFLKLDEKPIIVIGGGKIASDKISHLLDFTKNITIIAPKIDDKIENFIQNFSLSYHARRYEKGDVEGFFIAIVAVDDLSLQESIYHECQRFGVLCNAVDSIDYCDFIFPSYIKKDDLIIAFSTSGTSPALSKYLRRAMEKMLPKDIGEFLQKLGKLRKELPKGKKRMELLDKKAKEYIQKYFKG